MYNFNSESVKFSVCVTYIFLKLNMNFVKKFSQDSHTEIIMLSTFIIFELNLHCETVDAEMMTIFARK